MTRRVRLTDQGLVAVTLARDAAARAARVPTVADLLVALAVEPDGVAGHRLRAHAGAAVSLAQRAAAAPAHLPRLLDAVAHAARAAAPRPPGTADLLAAVLAVGGPDIADLLAAAGYSPDDLRPDDLRPEDVSTDVGSAAVLDRVPQSWSSAWSAASETVGLSREPDPRFSPGASVALARTRAVAGGAVELVLAIASAPEGSVADGDDLDPGVLAFLLDRLLAARTGEDTAQWDAGLEPVIAAALAWREGGVVTSADLLVAAALNGGRGPRRLLDEWHRVRQEDAAS